MITRFAALLLIVFAIVPAISQPAAAQDAPNRGGFAIWPVPEEGNPARTTKGYFIYNLAEGATTTGQVVLKNTGEVPIAVELTTVDALTSQTGGSAFATSNTSTSGPADWLQLTESRAQLDPDQHQAVSFNVVVPPGTAPGQYLAGIAAYIPKAPPTVGPLAQNQAGASVTMQMRYVIGVEIDVAGPAAPALTIAAVRVENTPSGVHLIVQMRNTGNQFLKPSGMLTLTDAAGNRVLEQAIKVGTFVTNTAIDYPVAWTNIPPAGTYRARVEMTYAGAQAATQENEVEVPVLVTDPPAESQGAGTAPGGTVRAQAPAGTTPGVEPWMIYGLGALLLVIIVLLLFILLRGRRDDKRSA